MVDETSSTEYQMPQIDVDKVMSIYAIREFLFKKNEELSEQVEEYVKGFVLENYGNYVKEIVTREKWWGFKETKEKGIVLSDGFREYYSDSFYVEIKKKSRKEFNRLLPEDLKGLCNILYSDDKPSNPDDVRKRFWVYEMLNNIYNQINGFETELTPPEGSSCTTKQLKTTSNVIDTRMSKLADGIKAFNSFVDFFYCVANRLGVFSGQEYELNAQDLEDSQTLKLYLDECNSQLNLIQEHKESDDLIDYVATLDKFLEDSIKMIGSSFGRTNGSSYLDEGHLKSIIDSLTVDQLENDKIEELVKEALPDLKIIG